MLRILFSLIFAIEIFALGNRGGAPLMSHLFLTGAVFLAVTFCIFAKPKIRFRFGVVEAGYILFMLFFVISLFTAKTPQYGLSEFLLYANAGLLVFLFSSLEIPKKDLDFLLFGLVAIAVLDTLVGFYLYTNLAFPRLVGTFMDLKRPYTSFGNDYANFILIILPLAAAGLFRKYARKTTALLNILAVSILFAGFLLSFSRAAWFSFAGVVLVLCIWLVIHRRRLGKIVENRLMDGKIALFRALAAFVICLFLVTGLQVVRSQKFETTSFFAKATFTADEGSTSATERVDFWRGAVNIIRDYPIFGGGIYSFKFLYPQYQIKFGINWGQPHNLFLKFGVENGIPAMVLSVIFLFAAAAVVIKFLWTRPIDVVLFLALGALGSLAHSLLDYNYIVANFTPLVVFLGISLSSASVVRPHAKEISKKVFLSVIFIASFGLLSLGLHEGFYNIDFQRGRNALTAGNLDQAVQRMEKAEKLFFQRDLRNYLSLAYQKQYEKTRDATWLEKEKNLLASALPASIDAGLFSRMGEIAMFEKSYAQAKNHFRRAIELDPENRLKYYYQLADSLSKQRKNLDAAMHAKIVALLDEYKIALAENRHLTVLTDNPQYADKLFGFLEMEKDKEEFDRSWFNEVLKFTIKYGAPPVTAETMI